MVKFFLRSLIWKILKLLYNLIQISLKFDLRYFNFTQIQFVQMIMNFSISFTQTQTQKDARAYLFWAAIFCFGDARAVTYIPHSLDTCDARAYETLDGCLHARAW